MRDPKRLAPFYEKLWAGHMQLPDWRFAQLMCNFCAYYGTNFNNLFYMEDAEFDEKFTNYCNAVTCKEESNE